MATKKLMTELSSDVLEKLQNTQIEILEEIVRICEKHQLRYFLIYGTLIGAIRHKGFIPWDDDLDIGMPREDYEKFLRIAKEELGDSYFLQDMETQKKYWLTFAKVRKNNTIFEETAVVNMPEYIHKGIFVDVFPLDYVKKKDGVLVYIQFALSKAIIETLYYKAGVYKKSSLRYPTLDLLMGVFSMKTLGKLQAKIAMLQRRKNATCFADFNSPRAYEKAIYPMEYFLPSQSHEFAGKTFQVPNSYDTYLRMIYGDYMQLPKEEDRVNHRTLRIVFDTTQENGR